MNDMITLSKAKYLLALSDMNVTEEIRGEYHDYIVDDETAIDALVNIIKTTKEMIKTGSETKKSCLDIISQEYDKLSLSTFICDYNSINNMVDKLLTVYSNPPIVDSVEKINLYKELVGTANDNNIIKDGIYYATLLSLLRGGDLYVDKEFSKNIVSYVDSINITESVKNLTVCIEGMLMSHMD